MPLRIAIKTVHYVIMNVAQDNTGTNNILNFLYVNFILFLFIFVLFDMLLIHVQCMYVLLWLKAIRASSIVNKLKVMIVLI